MTGSGENTDHVDACGECGGINYHAATCSEGQELAEAIKALVEYKPTPDMPTDADLKRRPR